MMCWLLVFKVIFRSEISYFLLLYCYGLWRRVQDVGNIANSGARSIAYRQFGAFWNISKRIRNFMFYVNPNITVREVESSFLTLPVEITNSCLFTYVYFLVVWKFACESLKFAAPLTLEDIDSIFLKVSRKWPFHCICSIGVLMIPSSIRHMILALVFVLWTDSPSLLFKFTRIRRWPFRPRVGQHRRSFDRYED